MSAARVTTVGDVKLMVKPKLPLVLTQANAPR